MRHIHQIGTDYVVVVTSREDLENHPSIINDGDLFEIVDGEIPHYSQYLIYEPEWLG